MLQPRPDVSLWPRDLSRTPYNRARDGSGMSRRRCRWFSDRQRRPVGSPTHGRARASVGAARAKPRHPPRRIGADSPTATDFGPAGAKALRRLKQRTMPRRGAVGAGWPAGRKRLKINKLPAPRRSRGAGLSINPFQRPAGRRGHSPAGGAPKLDAGAPELT